VSVLVKVEEDKSADAEVNHQLERVGYLIFEKDVIESQNGTQSNP
jgi:hypothetical protein